jgi:hypothetical protein
MATILTATPTPYTTHNPSPNLCKGTTVKGKKCTRCVSNDIGYCYSHTSQYNTDIKPPTPEEHAIVTYKCKGTDTLHDTCNVMTSNVSEYCDLHKEQANMIFQPQVNTILPPQVNTILPPQVNTILPPQVNTILPPQVTTPDVDMLQTIIVMSGVTFTCKGMTKLRKRCTKTAYSGYCHLHLSQDPKNIDPNNDHMIIQQSMIPARLPVTPQQVTIAPKQPTALQPIVPMRPPVTPQQLTAAPIVQTGLFVAPQETTTLHPTITTKVAANQKQTASPIIPIVLGTNEERVVEKSMMYTQDQKKECIVCTEELDKRDKVVFQCGHVVCKICQVKLTKCPTCRKTIKNRIPLFY